MATMVAAASVVLSSTALVARGAEAEVEVALRGDDNALDLNAHARVQGTFGLGLVIREGPGATYATRGSLPEGTRVQIVDGPRPDREGRGWFLVSTLTQTRVRGWSAADYLLPIDPNEPDPPVVTRPVVAAQPGVGGASGR